MLRIRKPSVANQFYPGNPQDLKEEIKTFLQCEDQVAPAPKAIIAPHAGYMFSGSVAGRVYARLRPVSNQIKRVILLGPAHRTHFYGIASLSYEALSTPLGNIPVDHGLLQQLEHLKTVLLLDRAHEGEHSLEVHLPFLQTVLEDFSVLPCLFGEATVDMISEFLKRVWGGPETLIVISSDLSHFLDYESARIRDLETSESITTFREADLSPDRACGSLAIAGLLQVAREKGLKSEVVDLRNSGDVTGARDRVVGYGAFAFH